MFLFFKNFFERRIIFLIFGMLLSIFGSRVYILNWNSDQSRIFYKLTPIFIFLKNITFSKSNDITLFSQFRYAMTTLVYTFWYVYKNFLNKNMAWNWRTIQYLLIYLIWIDDIEQFIQQYEYVYDTLTVLHDNNK